MVLSNFRWVGSMPVNAMSGKDVARQALQRLLYVFMCILDASPKFNPFPPVPLER